MAGAQNERRRIRLDGFANDASQMIRLLGSNVPVVHAGCEALGFHQCPWYFREAFFETPRELLKTIGKGGGRRLDKRNAGPLDLEPVVARVDELWQSNSTGYVHQAAT